MRGIEDVLLEHGYDLNSKTKLVRHTDNENLPSNCAGLDVLINEGWFPLYQSLQTKSRFDNCDFIVSFIGGESTSAIFYGVFRVLGRRTFSVDDIPVDCPYYDCWCNRYAGKYFYELEHQEKYADLKGNVVIEWGGSCIIWVQYMTNKHVL